MFKGLRFWCCTASVFLASFITRFGVWFKGAVFEAPRRIKTDGSKNRNTKTAPYIFVSVFFSFLRASRSSTSKENLAAPGFDPLTFRSKVDNLDRRITLPQDHGVLLT